MGSKKGLKSSKTTIISIIILDLIIMALFLFFSGRILADFQNSESISIIVISSFAIVVPGTLILLIIIQFYTIHKNRFSPGNSLKKHIVTYFILTTLLTIIPQSFISINFINAATNNWLNSQVRESVDTGLNLAIDLYNKKIDDLENISKSEIFNNILEDSLFNSKYKFEDLTQLNSSVSCVEIYTEDGALLKLLGNKILKTDSMSYSRNRFFYPKIKKGKLEILKYQYTKSFNGMQVYVILSSRLPENFTTQGSLLTEVKESLNQVKTHKKAINLGMFVYYGFFSIPLFLLAILGSFIFSDHIVKPITSIEEAIKRVAHGNYSYRILSKKKNEFNILISSFNNMIKEIEKSRIKLQHTEQISTWQDIATRLAHEIRNPLTPIKLSAQRVLLKGDKKDITDKYMGTIISEVTRMEKLLTEFRDFARFPQLTLNKTSMKESIEEGINIYRESYPNINFNLDGVENIELNIDKDQILQVISNLTINSIHSMDEKGVIEYFCSCVTKKGQEFCRVSIKDCGHGISESIKKDILKPYFTTKYDGSGIGLAIVNKIVLDHKGKIWIESAENVGTTFYFELPKEQL